MKTEFDFFIEVLKKELKQGDFKMTANVLLRLSKESNKLYKSQVLDSPMIGGDALKSSNSKIKLGI